jgi:hypothetical protein
LLILIRHKKIHSLASGGKKKTIVAKTQSHKPTTLHVAGIFDIIFFDKKLQDNLDCCGKGSKGKKLVSVKSTT